MTVKGFAQATKEIRDRHIAEAGQLTVFMAPSKKLQVICVVVIIPWRSQNLKGQISYNRWSSRKEEKGREWAQNMTLTSWEISCDTATNTIIHLAGKPGVGFHRGSDAFSYTNQKTDSEGEVQIEKMKRCVFTVPQPIHYVGVEKGRYICEWLNSLRMLVRHSLRNAMADPAHNNLEPE